MLKQYSVIEHQSVYNIYYYYDPDKQRNIFLILLNQTEFRLYLHHFPIDLKPNGIYFAAKSIGKV